MAQTRKKRRRKHRGTQGGRIDRRPVRGRARSRAEAQARARNRTKKKGGPRVPEAPSWSSALKKGGIAAVLFVVLLTVFGQNPAVAVLVGVLMMGFYVPMAFLLDRFMYQRHLRKEAQKRAEREAQRTGAGQAEG
jgi:Flp pilus assembly protein TadB